MKQVQTDNSYFLDKVKLRLNNLPDKKTISVLEMYSGDSLLWKRIKSLSPKTIEVLRIDKKPDRQGIYLRGENIKYIELAKRTQFDIIDLDAYGVPFDLLEYIFKNGIEARIFATFIQSMFGCLPRGMLNALGYTDGMVEKCPTLFNRDGFGKFKQYLANNGVKEIKYRSTDRKNYVAFDTKGKK